MEKGGWTITTMIENTDREDYPGRVIQSPGNHILLDGDKLDITDKRSLRSPSGLLTDIAVSATESKLKHRDRERQMVAEGIIGATNSAPNLQARLSQDTQHEPSYTLVDSELNAFPNGRVRGHLVRSKFKPKWEGTDAAGLVCPVRVDMDERTWMVKVCGFDQDPEGLPDNQYSRVVVFGGSDGIEAAFGQPVELERPDAHYMHWPKVVLLQDNPANSFASVWVDTDTSPAHHMQATKGWTFDEGVPWPAVFNRHGMILPYRAVDGVVPGVVQKWHEKNPDDGSVNIQSAKLVGNALVFHDSASGSQFRISQGDQGQAFVVLGDGSGSLEQRLEIDLGQQRLTASSFSDVLHTGLEQMLEWKEDEREFEN